MTENKKETPPAESDQYTQRKDIGNTKPFIPDILKKLYEMGLTLVPIKPETKKPYEKYGQWKQKRMDMPTLSGIAAEYPDANWAVYCVGGIVGLDFDCPRTYEEHFSTLDTLTTRSPSGGYHPILRSLILPKPVESLGIELKINELITVIGKGYEILKDLPIKEVQDIGELVKKSLPKFPKKKDASLLKDIKISDIVSKYLKKIDEGHNYWRAYCPFHGDDKTPHLYVFESSNQWHCFRCKKHGFPVNFVMEKENFQYKDALKKLEELLGISLRSESEKTRAGDLVQYTQNGNVELFHDDVKEPYAKIKISDHWEIFALKDRGFKRWLTQQYYNDMGDVPNKDAVMGALGVIEAKAVFGGKQHSLHNRVCWHENAIWYDLGNWEAIRITENAWDLIKDPPILFRRFQHQREHDVSAISRGNPRKILNFINIKDAGEQVLFLTHLVSCFVPGIPHPSLAVHGEQGSAKSTLLKIYKELVDPSAVKILSFPKDNTELVQLLSHHYFAPFDNVSYLSDWQSDALCRACTGEGISKRMLYTDDDDVIYTFMRCVALNGINLAVTKPDLLDRSILLQLESFPKGRRKSDRKFWAEFLQAKGEILGGLLDVLAKAMTIYPTITVEDPPRMADFCEWACAISEALGYGQQAFLDAYSLNIQFQNREAIEASPVGDIVLKFMDDQDEWEGTSSDLLTELELIADALKINIKRMKGWPKAPQTLSKRMNDIKTNLSKEGIFFEKSRERTKRTLTLRKNKGNIVTTVTSSPSQSADAIKDDGTLKTDRHPVSTTSSQPEKNDNMRSRGDDLSIDSDNTQNSIPSPQKQGRMTPCDGSDDGDDVSRTLAEVERSAREWEKVNRKNITQTNIVKATFSLKPQFPSISADDLIALLRKYAKIPQSNDDNPSKAGAGEKPITTIQINGKEIPVVWEE